MSGSASAYAGKALLWDLATILSLGLALPWRIAALERYKMCNTRFGNLPGNFVPPAAGGARSFGAVSPFGGSLRQSRWSGARWLWLWAVGLGWRTMV